MWMKEWDVIFCIFTRCRCCLSWRKFPLDSVTYQKSVVEKSMKIFPPNFRFFFTRACRVAFLWYEEEIDQQSALLQSPLVTSTRLFCTGSHDVFRCRRSWLADELRRSPRAFILLFSTLTYRLNHPESSIFRQTHVYASHCHRHWRPTMYNSTVIIIPVNFNVASTIRWHGSPKAKIASLRFSVHDPDRSITISRWKIRRAKVI